MTESQLEWADRSPSVSGSLTPESMNPGSLPVTPRALMMPVPMRPDQLTPMSTPAGSPQDVTPNQNDFELSEVASFEGYTAIFRE